MTDDLSKWNALGANAGPGLAQLAGFKTSESAGLLPWTDERVAEAKRLWASKDWTGSAIAERLGGTTRNAVVALAHRKGWPSNTNLRVRKRKAEPRPPRPKPVAAPPIPLPEFTTLPHMGQSPHAKPFMLTTSRQCRWALGRADEPAHAMMMVCGAATVEGRPYCEAHCVRAGSGYAVRRIRPPFESTVRPSVWS